MSIPKDLVRENPGLGDWCILYVRRHDAQQLLEIKRGEWTLDQVKAESDRLFKNAE